MYLLWKWIVPIKFLQFPNTDRPIVAFIVTTDASKPNGSNSLEMLDRMTRFV